MRVLSKSESDDLFTEDLAWAEVNMDTGIITYATRPFEKMFGYKIPGALEGGAIESLVPVDRREIHANEHRPTFNSNPEPRMMGGKSKLEGQRKDGSVFPVEVLLLPKAVNGKRIVICLVVDMTGRIPP